MARKYWRGREIDTGEPEELDPLGPDERDGDLLEDRWESVRFDSPKPPAPAFVRYGVAALSIIAAVSILVPLVAAAVR